MPNEFEKRISTNEANIRNMDQNFGLAIIEFRDYMKSSTLDRATNHNEIIQRLAVIETKQDLCKIYQQSCDQDREKLSDDVLKLKINESRNAGKASVWAVIVATVTSGCIAILSAIYGAVK